MIYDDHHEQRQRFAMRDDIDRSGADTLRVVWARLATFREVHAAAEEKHFHPALLKIGEGAGSKDSAAAETTDAIGDRNDIRDAVAKVALRDVGSKGWYTAIARAEKPTAATWVRKSVKASPIFAVMPA